MPSHESREFRIYKPQSEHQMVPEVLWHVTPRENVPLIARRGLDPQLSRGSFARVWMTAAPQRPSWLKHMMRATGCHWKAFALFHVNVKGLELKRTGHLASYTYDRVIETDRLGVLGHLDATTQPELIALCAWSPFSLSFSCSRTASLEVARLLPQ